MSGPHEQPEPPNESAGGETGAALSRRALRLVGEALGSIRYGQVILTIHDGVVVQFDKLEKTRLR